MGATIDQWMRDAAKEIVGNIGAEDWDDGFHDSIAAIIASHATSEAAIKKECDDALGRAFKAESSLMELRDKEFIAKVTLQRFMDWLAGEDKEFSRIILRAAKHPCAPSEDAAQPKPSPFLQGKQRPSLHELVTGEIEHNDH